MSKAPTIARAALIQMAARIEAHANESLKYWAITGHSAKYGACLDQAAALRRAADEKNLHVRREMVRNAGVAA